MSVYERARMRESFSKDDRAFVCNNCGEYTEGNDLLLHLASTSGKCMHCGETGVMREVEYANEEDLYDDDDDWI